ncbi:Hypothetical protein SMAX5B_021180 [Scophthalmus maximus]|uniref:Uncharacterized protein n=1 Tax=Scophthalmus maximus TaxID=52904 RepID=A0A2U9BMK5_SCOMX|nr:Hypothetical protein SMAX5B_021180 [Scophthalmus maximus]
MTRPGSAGNRGTVAMTPIVELLTQTLDLLRRASAGGGERHSSPRLSAVARLCLARRSANTSPDMNTLCPGPDTTRDRMQPNAAAHGTGVGLMLDLPKKYLMTGWSELTALSWRRNLKQWEAEENQEV